MFRPFNRPSSGQPLNNSSIKSVTFEMLAHYGIPCSLKPHGISQCASISYVLDLIELLFNGWPDDGHLKSRNM
jgi:hypothetical protein